jgi:hypothetical protein
MGVDIYGRKPITKSERPEQIDFHTATDDEKQKYWNKVEEWEEENPGEYFRSNWWGWRPICMMCEVANDKYKLKLNMSNWGSNDGAGLRTQKQCDRLADALELMLSNDSGYNEFMIDDSDRIQIVMGAWCEAGTGKFYSDEANELNEQYPFGTILYSAVVTKKGTMVESAHSCSLSHIKRWITFLRHCGGFKIW